MRCSSPTAASRRRSPEEIAPAQRRRSVGDRAGAEAPIAIASRAVEPVRGGASAPTSVAATLAAVIAVGVWAVWAGWGPVRETLAVAGSPSTNGRLLRARRALPCRARARPCASRCRSRARTGRPPSSRRACRSRAAGRSSSTCATTACCSRSALTAASYERWLHEQACRYVALPDVELDPSSAREGKLIRAGLPYLRQVFASRHWRIYAVRSPHAARLRARTVDLARARLLRAERVARQAASSCACTTRPTGRSRVVPAACRVAPAGGRRSMRAQRGRLLVHASFSLGRALSAWELLREPASEAQSTPPWPSHAARTHTDRSNPSNKCSCRR